MTGQLFSLRRLVGIAVWLCLAACSSPAISTPGSISTPVGVALTPSLDKTLAECRESVPQDRRFALPPWPNTNFCRHSVPYDDIISGGVPRDRIPAIDRPIFETVEQASVWLADVEPVIVFELNDDVRAYPLQVLVWHEIVNDTVGGEPVVVTYCPLCNSAIAFRRAAAGQVLDFGTTGNLRNADLIMYDRQTESWWQQFTGEAIVGELTGARLEVLPTAIVSWADFKAQFPDGKVLSADTGYEREYGETPYLAYDSLANPRAGFLNGVPDDRLPPKMRVLAVTLGNTAIAYPYSVLSQVGAINDARNGVPVVIFWQSGTTSALYKRVIAESKDVGSAMAFSRELDGRLLTFSADGEQFVDRETGSAWDLFGTAIAGPLAGRQLEPIPSHELLWFAWAAFRPDTLVYSAP